MKFKGGYPSTFIYHDFMKNYVHCFCILNAVARALIGGGGVYSYIRVMPE